MLLRLTFPIALLLGLTSCIGLKPKPDNIKTYLLGPSDLAKSDSGALVAQGYIARPQLPTYLEGYTLKKVSKEREIVTISKARWAEPVHMGVARAISSYIKTLSGGIRSDFYPWTHTKDATFTLQLNFYELIATDDNRILISVSWKCNYAEDKVITGFFENSELKWSGNARSMVDGINKALGLLAAEIVESLKKEILTAK